MTYNKSHANGNGDIVPSWLRMNWELRALVWPTRVTIYDFP